jgi:fatty acid desaturase
VVRGRVFAVYDVMYNVAFVAAGLVMVPLWRLGRERSLLWLIATGFVLGWLLVGVAMLGWGWRRSDPGPRRRRAAGRVAALVVGALPALAFPAPSWWWLAWVGVVPLLLVVRAAPTARELCDNSFEATSETVRRGTSPGSVILAMPVSQLKK